jgi:hypothetical protein
VKEKVGSIKNKFIALVIALGIFAGGVGVYKVVSNGGQADASNPDAGLTKASDVVKQPIAEKINIEKKEVTVNIDSNNAIAQNPVSTTAPQPTQAPAENNSKVALNTTDTNNGAGETTVKKKKKNMDEVVKAIND